MTYYRIWKYLVKMGLTKNQAHYVRNMIRELVKQKQKEAYDQGAKDGATLRRTWL